MDGRRVDGEAARRLGKNLWRARGAVPVTPRKHSAALPACHRTGGRDGGERRAAARIDTLMKLAAALEVRLEALVEGIEWLPPGPPAEGSFAVRRAA